MQYIHNLVILLSKTLGGMDFIANFFVVKFGSCWDTEIHRIPISS